MSNKQLLSNLSYQEQVAYHKGAFSTLLALKNVVEHMQTGINSKLFTKKAYRLILSYLDESIKNIDELLAYHGLQYGIVDKNGNYKRVDELQASLFIQHNKERYQEIHQKNNQEIPKENSLSQ